MVRFPNQAPLKTAAHWTKSKKWKTGPTIAEEIQTLLLVHGHSVNSSPFGFYFEQCCIVKTKVYKI